MAWAEPIVMMRIPYSSAMGSPKVPSKSPLGWARGASGKGCLVTSARIHGTQDSKCGVAIDRRVGERRDVTELQHMPPRL
jgi:hypothetical protein